ncbi:hypothetical protein DS167_20525 [Salmonella enterica subsp. enterica serovar Newport]|nr:hypothetical protein [Salmonella enterica subsp. enterica serovar Newport]
MCLTTHNLDAAQDTFIHIIQMNIRLVLGMMGQKLFGQIGCQNFCLLIILKMDYDMAHSDKG